MTNDNTRTKANAVFFSVIMVLSVVAIGFAAAPAAANETSPDIRPGNISAENPTKLVNTSTSTNQSVVFQGETVTPNGSLEGSAILTGVAGAAEGQVLDLNQEIPTDQTPGTYTTTGEQLDVNGSVFGVTVNTPRISTAEVRYEGDDISSIAVEDADNSTDGTFTAFAEFNFEEAENVSVEVQDESGTDITPQVTTSDGSTILADGGEVGLDLSNEDAGEYTVIFEGDVDLDYGDVVEEYTFTLTDQNTIELETAEDSVTRGDNLQYTVTGATNNEYHLVTIEASDFRDGISNEEAQGIFRNVGDTERVGAFNGSAVNAGTEITSDEDQLEYAYAVVQAGGSQALGEVETQFLDDTNVELEVYNATDSADDANTSNFTSEDDIEFDVTEGAVSLTNPTDSYTVGQDVDVTGEATSADNVRLYAKDNDDWEIVQLGSGGIYNISVDSDDTFEETDVVLSEGAGGGNQILAFEGRYEIGVIDLQDATDVENLDNGDLNTSTISTSDWTTSESSRVSINVVEGDLTANFVTFNGQVAEEDNVVDVNGTAAGQSDVVVAFVDDRGGVAVSEVSVDSDDAFDEDDLDIADLRQGTVSAHVISLGRDGNVGDGELPSVNSADSTDDLVSFIEDLDSSTSLSGDQVRSRILSETVEDDASDDLIVTETFRLSDGRVSIDSVNAEGADASGVNPVAAGDTMVVTGTTNRQADDNSVVVEVLDDEGNSLVTASTDQWDTDGVYTVSLDTSDLETSAYTLEADTGDNTDQVVIEIVESVEEETTEEETEEETTEEETTEEETTEEETEEETTEEETTEEETTEEETTEEEATDDSTPGFGALVALVALVAAALLATRRRDE